MIDSKARFIVNKPVDFAAKLANKAKLTPDQVTILALIVGLIACYFIANDRIILAVTFLWISGFLDVVDGQLARISGKTSKSGALLDMIMDRMVESFYVFGMVIANEEYAIIVILFLISIIFNFSTFLAAGALMPNDGKKSMYYDIGLIERTETFIFLTFATLFIPFRILILSSMVLLIGITGILRFMKIYSYLKNVKE